MPISSSHPEVASAQTDPIRPMVLNIVARLKDAGAQLARKSTQSPNPALYQGVGDALASLTPVQDPQPSQSRSGSVNPRQVLVVPAQHSELLSAAASLVASGGSALPEDDEATGNDDSSPETEGADDETAPDGEAAEGEGDANTDEDLLCSDEDCTEVKTNNNSPHNVEFAHQISNAPGETNIINNNNNQLIATDRQPASQMEVPEAPTHIIVSEVPKYSVPVVSPYEPAVGNELYPPMISSEYNERQISSAASSYLSSNWLVMYLVGLLLMGLLRVIGPPIDRQRVRL